MLGEDNGFDRYSTGSRIDRREERLVRALVIAFKRGDRVAGHSLTRRLNAVREEQIEQRAR